MRKLISAFVIFIVIFIGGCSSMLPPKYDNNEYLILAKLETHSRLMYNDCSKPTQIRFRLPVMLFNAELLNTYSFFLPRNTELYEISKILVNDVKEMQKKYQQPKLPSTLYCKLKMKTFIKKARRALKAVGTL